MIDILLMNPTVKTNTVVSILEKHNLTYEIYAVPGTLFGYNVPVVLPATWGDSSDNFKSIIGFSQMGWLDHLSKRVELRNNDIDRSSTYLTNAPTEDNTTLFSFVSYKGQHVLLDGFIIRDTTWRTFKETSRPLFNNTVNSAMHFLSEAGITNGPSQVYRYPDGKLKLFLAPRTLKCGSENKASTKSFFDIWPLLIKSNDASVLFDNWAFGHGDPKKFTVPDNS